MSVTPISSDQEAFSKAYRWAKYNEPCVNERGACAYRNASGNRCLVGALMPEDMAENVHNTGIVTLLRHSVDTEVNELFSNLDTALLISLQCAHDHAYNNDLSKEAYLAELREVATSFGLTVPEQ